jgi:transposase
MHFCFQENANNSSFSDYLLNTNLNVSTNKCNLTSPAPNTNSSTNSIYDTNSLLCNGLYSSSSAYSSYKVESNTSLSDSPPSLNNTRNNSASKQHLADGLNDSKKRKNSVDQMSNKVNGDPKADDVDGDDDDNDSEDSDDVVGNGVESQTSSEDDIDDNDDGYANDQSEIFNSTAESNIKIDTSFLKFTTSNTDQNEKNIKKAKVVELYTQGERCVRKLSQITGVPLTTVYRVIGKLKGINYNIPRGNGAGRKTILDTKDREILVNILNIHPRISRKALGKELEKCTGKSIHSSTLNRELCRLRHHGRYLVLVVLIEKNFGSSPYYTIVLFCVKLKAINYRQPILQLLRTPNWNRETTRKDPVTLRNSHARCHRHITRILVVRISQTRPSNRRTRLHLQPIRAKDRQRQQRHRHRMQINRISVKTISNIICKQPQQAICNLQTIRQCFRHRPICWLRPPQLHSLINHKGNQTNRATLRYHHS